MRRMSRGGQVEMECCSVVTRCVGMIQTYFLRGKRNALTVTASLKPPVME